MFLDTIEGLNVAFDANKLPVFVRKFKGAVPVFTLPVMDIHRKVSRDVGKAVDV